MDGGRNCQVEERAKMSAKGEGVTGAGGGGGGLNTKKHPSHHELVSPQQFR